jgi:PAS domain S-box-containing protein
MERRQDKRVTRPGRRGTDRRPPAADNRRVLLVGPDEAWRLLHAYVFEEAGYAVYAAADESQAAAFTARLLPDALIVHAEVPDTPDLTDRLSRGSGTRDIPVLVLTSALESIEAQEARAAGAITVTVHPGHIDLLVDEVDTLIAGAARAQRSLKRRLLDLQELARYYTPDAEGQASLRRLIDHLQVAILAVDEQGRCIAASDGATMLTGYTRGQLLTTSVFQAQFAGGQMSDARWRGFLANRQYTGITTITNRAGEHVTVHAAAVAEIMPGFHVAAFAAA